MRRQWQIVGAIILVLLIAVLSVLNVEAVPINFGFTVVEWPLIIVIFGSVLLGAIIATLLSTFREYKEHRSNKNKQSIGEKGKAKEKRSKNN